MIYLFNDVKELTGTVRNNHILNLLYEREKNGIYSVSAEIPVTYNDQGTIYNYNKKIQKSDFLGHYDREGRFQLHKIAAVDIENGSIFVKGIHIFFDEAKAGAIIKDRRFINREIIDGARVAFESIGWSVTDFDVSVGKTYNFYNVTPLEARQILVETFGFEFDYWLDFDGKKVTNRHVAVKEKIGEKTNKRYTYGHNVLNIRAEQDYSEIYTAVIGRGKGEEIEETGGYGRRIEYTDVVWTTPSKPLNKPAGTRILEDPNATQLFGYKENGVVKPRIKVEVFPDIESPTELIQASYEWLMDNNVPKAVFSLKVADGDGLNLGDEVYVIYRDIDLVKSARVEKVIDDLVSGNRDVEFGDTAYFDTDRRLSGLKSDLKRYSGETGDRIYRLKMEFNRRFDEEVSSWVSEFEQNLIDQKALIEADRENMTNLIEDTRESWTNEFEQSVAEAERKRQENYDAMSDYVNTSIDTTRTAVMKEITDNIAEAEHKAQQEHDAIKERIVDTVATTKEDLESSISTSIDTAKQYAEQQAQAKAEAVRTDLETVTSGHRSMLDSLQDNVMSIDNFIGDKTIGLNELLYNERALFEEKLKNVDTWHYNMLRGTRFDEGIWQGYSMEKVEEDINYFEFVPTRNNSNIPYIQTTQEVYFSKDETYTLSFDFQTYAVRQVNYIWMIATEDETEPNTSIWSENRIIEGTHLHTYWGKDFNRYYLKFKPIRSMRAYLRLGVNLHENGEYGRRGFKFRLPYLTSTDNTRWLYHQLDSSQNVEEITRRITQLEDGREEFITKSQYDFETGEIEGSIKHIIETVDESTLIMQNHENWITTNGASIERTVDGFDSKAWLSDIQNPNLLAFTDVAELSHRIKWGKWRAPTTGAAYSDFARFRNQSVNYQIGAISPTLEIIEGETYTLSWSAFIYDDTLNHFDYCYIMTPDGNEGITPLSNRPKRTLIPTSAGSYGGNPLYKYELTFTAPIGHKEASVMIGATAKVNGVDASFAFKEPKLEIGDRATPYHNAFSNLTQRADEIMLAVQGVGENGFLSQSDISIKPDYVQIGSQRLDGSGIGSMLRVSPTGISMIADAMLLSGDLYVDGDIKALAVNAVRGDIAYLKTNILTANSVNATHIQSEVIGADQIRANSALINKLFANNFAAGHITTTALKAVEGEFAKLFAAQVEANTISVDYISGRTAWFERLYTLNANIEKLTSQFVFTDAINAKIGNFIDINAGNIVTAGLSANVINSDHIQVGTALIDKMFATSARIDRLITKTHFVNEMNALTMNVIDLNASQIRTRLLSANTIEANWLKTGTALIDRIFSSTAMFERMMAKSGFIATLNTVTIDTDQLTIRRPDGGVLISNGTQRFGSPIITKAFPSTSVSFDGVNYVTSSRGSQTFERAYGEHSGRYANFSIRYGLRWDSDDASSMIGIVIRPGTMPSGVNPGTHIEEVMAYRGDMRNKNFSIRMPVPTFGAVSWTLEFYRIGDNSPNYVQVRSERCWMSA